MKSLIFWDMTPRSLLSFNRSFGGTYRLHAMFTFLNLFSVFPRKLRDSAPKQIKTLSFQINLSSEVGLYNILNKGLPQTSQVDAGTVDFYTKSVA
jgi:hypothetical protein